MTPAILILAGLILLYFVFTGKAQKIAAAAIA